MAYRLRAQSAEWRPGMTHFCLGDILVLREYCGSRSCSPVLGRVNRNGRQLAKLSNIKPILGRAAGS